MTVALNEGGISFLIDLYFVVTYCLVIIALKASSKL